MQASDVDAVARIEAASFSDAWPASAFSSLLKQAHARLRVVEGPGGDVLGYCVLLRAADEGEIANICSAPPFRGQGVGGLLLDDALAASDRSNVQSLFLEVRVSNSAARGLYASRGFVEVGRRRAYYGNPTEDALVLRRVRPKDIG